MPIYVFVFMSKSNISKTTCSGNFDYSDNNIDNNNPSLNNYNDNMDYVISMDSKNNSQTDLKNKSQKYEKYGKRRYKSEGHD